MSYTKCFMGPICFNVGKVWDGYPLPVGVSGFPRNVLNMLLTVSHQPCNYFQRLHRPPCRHS